MRAKLFDLLTHKLKTPAVGPNGWEHITSQIGMFSFTGLNRAFSFPSSQKTADGEDVQRRNARR